LPVLPGFWPGFWPGFCSAARTPACTAQEDIAGAVSLEHLTLEMLTYGRQKPAFAHFVARIFKKILAEQLAHFIR